MKNKLRSLLCMLLSLCMTMSMLPLGAVYAAADEIEAEEEILTEDVWEEVVDLPEEEQFESEQLPEESGEELVWEEEPESEEITEIPEEEQASEETVPEEELPEEVISEEDSEEEEILDEDAGFDQEETVEVQEIVTINPAYVGLLSEEDIPSPDFSQISPLALTSYTSIADAGAFLRQQMVNRVQEISFIILNTNQTNFNIVYNNLLNQVYAHTGVPNQGDYLYWQCSGNRATYAPYGTGSGSYQVTFTCTYITTAAQETALNNTFNSVMSSLNLSGKTEYQKVKAIYDYITKNVVYGDTSNALHHSAYSALCSKTAVCQGFAALFYRMALSAGLDNRIISGNNSNHGWNIVKLGGCYYNVDTTWDSQRVHSNMSYAYFLKNEANFTSHTRDSRYQDAAFVNYYPISASDYNPSAEYSGELDIPRITSLSPATNGVTVKWNHVPGAVNYTVFYKSNTAYWIPAGNTTSNTYTVTGLTSGTTYAFTLRCISADGTTYTSNYDDTGKSLLYIAAPNITSVANAANGVTIKWDKVTGAAKYRVFYKTSGGSWVSAGDTTGTSLTKTGLTSGTAYTFTVRCINSAGNAYTSAYNTTGKTITYYPLLPTPVITSASVVSNGISLKWNAVPGAVKYRVFYKIGSGNWTTVGDLTATSCTVTGLTAGTKYTLTVRCVSADGKTYTSNYDQTGKTLTFTTTLATPTLVSVSNVSGGVSVKWNAVTGAAKYRVFYKTTNSNWMKAGDTTGTSYTVTGLTNNWNYWFTVRAITADGSAYTSGYNTTGLKICYQIIPVLVSVSNVSGGVAVKWNSLSGAVKYRVFYKTTNGNWTKAGDTTGTSYTVTGLTNNWKYWFTVRAITADGSAYTSGYNASGLSITYLSSQLQTPVLKSVANNATGVNVVWSAVSGAAKYRVFYKTAGGSWTKAGDTTGTSYNVTKLTSGTTYYFTVRCIDASGTTYTSGYNTAGLSMMYLTQPVMKSLTNSGANIILSWDAVPGAVNYRVFYKTSSSGSWTKLGDTKVPSCTIQGLSAGQAVWFTVRCINEAGTAYTSSYNANGWSIVKT